MYIEPCCIDRQLPELLRSGVPFFQTSGDVTFDKFLSSVSSLAGSEFSLILIVPEVDVKILQILNHYFNRGWLSSLLLLTREVQTELVKTELAGHAHKIQYAADPLIIDSQCAMIGTAEETTNLETNAAVIIQGAMLSEADFSYSLYGCYFGRNKDIVKGALLPSLSKLRMKPIITSDDETINRVYSLVD